MARWLDVFRLRLRSLLRRGVADRDLDRELRFHLDQHIAELMAGGASPADAERAAHLAFGSTVSATEACRDHRRINFAAHFAQDLRYAVRGVIRQPLLLVAAATSIALGAGVNLAIFGLANTLFLSAPSSFDPDRLVHIRTKSGSHTSYRVWRAFRDSAVIAGIAGYRFDTALNWRDADLSIPITSLQVTANFFDVVGMPIAQGRGFTAVEAEAEREPRLVVVSDGFWKRRLGGSAATIGSTLALNGEPYTVIGIAPPDLRSLPGFGLAPEVFVPITRSLAPNLDRVGAGHLQLIGRLYDDQAREAALAALATVAERLSGELGGSDWARVRYVGFVGGLEQTRELKEIAAFFGVLLLVTMLVLAIACANVAGLLLARSTVRRREIALRLALGATRRRVVQHLLTEGLMLATTGTVAGLALTAVAGSLLPLATLAVPVPVQFQLSFDSRLMWFALMLVVGSTLLCALAPALQATRPAVMPAIRNDTPAYGHRRFTLRNVMVAGQVAVSALLLVTTMLFLRNLALAHTMSPEFDADRALVAQVTFVEGRQGPPSAPAIKSVVDRLASMPGLEAVAYSWELPLSAYTSSTGTRMRIEGIEHQPHVEYSDFAVSPGFFRAIGIELLRGRDFTDADRDGAPLAVIVNQEFVRRYFEGQDPIYRHIWLPTDPEPTPAAVVGVVANSKYRTIGEDRTAAMYLSYLQRPRHDRFVHVVARTVGAPQSMSRQVRDVVLQADPSAAVTIEPMTSTLAFAFLPSRIGAALVGSLGLLGAMLAMVGLYGVVAFAVARRTSEIGIRVALGASRSAVARLVLYDASVLVATGLVVGLALTFFIAQPLSAFLVATLPPRDPLSFAASAALLVATSLLASWHPARRAMRISPGVALRVE
jgi:putative ABC transport system permease protein